MKPGLGALIEQYGIDFARAAYGETDKALKFLKQLIATHQIDCELNFCGRYRAAISPAHYQAMESEQILREKYLGQEYVTVPRSQQTQEMATDRFFGGVLVPDGGTLHRGRYHLGLMRAAEEAGA